MRFLTPFQLVVRFAIQTQPILFLNRLVCLSVCDGFKQDYSLTPLDEVQYYLAHHKHLPEAPSAKEVLKKGRGVLIPQLIARTKYISGGTRMKK